MTSTTQFDYIDLSDTDPSYNGGGAKLTLPCCALFRITGLGDKPTKDKTGSMLEIKLEVLASSTNSADVGKIVSIYLNLNNRSADAVRIAKQDLSKLVANTVCTPQLQVQSLIGQQFIGACIQDGDFMRIRSYMNSVGMQVYDFYGNTREPEMGDHQELTIERAKLLAQFGQAPTAQTVAAVQQATTPAPAPQAAPQAAPVAAVPNAVPAFVNAKAAPQEQQFVGVPINFQPAQ